MMVEVMKMFEIKGQLNTAICYAKVVEDEAIEQIRKMCDYELTSGQKVRIMPDVHSGKGCTIGTTMTVGDKVCPNIVGSPRDLWISRVSMRPRISFLPA